MGRSRSRSPPNRERRRSGSRDRERKGTLPFSGQGKAKEPLAFSSPQATLKGKTEEEIEMMKIMGFGNFDTTKGRKTDGAVNAHVINVSQKRKYRYADSLSLETTRVVMWFIISQITFKTAHMQLCECCNIDCI
uniref:U4/U6.U5 small nuclear ribonucleoprotein 27 kDa protein n=1 Tax=Hucho hucho TaxID=62062 RepID=A0A4W5RIT2_9TELE